MIFSKENSSTRERRVPVPICSPQFPHRHLKISFSKDETRRVSRNVVFIYQTTRCHVTEDIILLKKLERHDRTESDKKLTSEDN
jgi:hypothetical protein